MFYKIAHAVAGIVFRVIYRLRVTGRGNVPGGGALVCANHSSLADPVLVALALSSRDRLRFMAKIELFGIPGLKQLITALGAYPIDRGHSDLQAIKTSLGLLKDDKKVLMFPQGGRVLPGEALAVKAGAAMLAARSGMPILPVYITEGRKPFINPIEVIVGQPFPAEMQPGRSKPENYEIISDRLVAEIVKLSKQTKRAAKSAGGASS